MYLTKTPVQLACVRACCGEALLEAKSESNNWAGGNCCRRCRSWKRGGNKQQRWATGSDHPPLLPPWPHGIQTVQCGHTPWQHSSNVIVVSTIILSLWPSWLRSDSPNLSLHLLQPLNAGAGVGFTILSWYMIWATLSVSQTVGRRRSGNREGIPDGLQTSALRSNRRTGGKGKRCNYSPSCWRGQHAASIWLKLERIILNKYLLVNRRGNILFSIILRDQRSYIIGRLDRMSHRKWRET